MQVCVSVCEGMCGKFPKIRDPHLAGEGTTKTTRGNRSGAGIVKFISLDRLSGNTACCVATRNARAWPVTGNWSKMIHLQYPSVLHGDWHQI